jgi:hypothetical protein
MSFLKSILVPLVAIAGVSAAPAVHADYDLLTFVSPTNVLDVCNPGDSPSKPTCKVLTSPGLPGFKLVASQASPIIINEVTIGTIYDKVWKDILGNYIFGAQVVINTNQWDASGTAFRVNDVFCCGRPKSEPLLKGVAAEN